MSKKRNQKTTSDKIFEGVMEGLKDAGNFLKGKPNKCIVHSPIDIKQIRSKQGFSQNKFANEFGISVETLRNWEQGKRTPDRTAQILLAVIDRYPDVVREVVDLVETI